MGILNTILGGVVSVFVKKNTATDESGQETEQRAVRPFPTAAAVVIGFILLYHMIIWPWLNYHFPEYEFPPIDLGILSILGGIM